MATNREKLIELYNKNLKDRQITVVKIRNGKFCIMVGPNLFIGDDGFMDYDEDSLEVYNHEYDIIDVYTKAVGCIGYSDLTNNLIHQCSFNKYVELTMDEIANKFGISVEQLKIKKQ